MGLFLEVGILKNCDKNRAKRILDEWSKSSSSDILPADCKLDEQSGETVMILNDHSNFEGNEKFFRYVSAETKNTVMSLYIYDGDYWGYNLFVDGQEIDRFNPVPDYFEDINDSEKGKCAGDSSIIAKYFNVNEGDIKNYLCFWTEEKTEGDPAYSDDEFGYEDWQIVDFMKKLGYLYPCE